MNPEEIKMYRKHLTTLTTHLRKYEKPKPCGYDAFATTYLSGEIPWKKILSEEADPNTTEPVPFSPKFEIEEFTLQEKERKLRGESVRKKIIIPSSHEIFQHFKEAEIPDRDAHLGYLYFKAMQYSEVNKALALDESYPKPDSNVLRTTFSKEHQEAIAAVYRDMEKAAAEKSDGKVSVEAPFLQRKGNLFTIPTLVAASERSRTMATEGEMKDLEKFRQVIQEAMDMPTVFTDFQLTREPWQFKAKTGRPRPQPPKKPKTPWKKNVYPPKSKEERIAELRSMAPPLEPEYLETDHLPGLWEPELMIDSFKTAFMEAQEEQDGQEEEDWWKLFSTKIKCLEWLRSIPDTL